MKSRILKFIPAYLRNFNIEQRVQSKLDEIDHSNKPAPWHQSTAHFFEIIKDSSAKKNEKKQNEIVEKRARSIKILSNGPGLHPEVADKRPKKENELIHYFENQPDHDFAKYSYHSPKNVQPGYLTLREFDKFLNEINSNYDKNKLEKFCQKNKIKMEDVKTLLQYLKPLYKLEIKSNK